MASGDKAAAQGFTPVLATDDFRLGYVRINDAADFAAYVDGPAPTYAGTVVPWASDWPTLLRKEGGVVTLSAALKNPATGGGISSGNTLMTLPTGYRPKANIAFVCPTYNSGTGWDGRMAHLQISPDGTVSVTWMSSSLSNNGFVAISQSFVAA